MNLFYLFFFNNCYLIQGDEQNIIKYNNSDYIEYKYKKEGFSFFQTPFSENIIDYIIVAGGGGGGSRHSGGGGAGGVIIASNIKISNWNYSLFVGKGGLGGNGSDQRGNNGEDSTFLGEISKGGGGGSYEHNANGLSGGCGGGGSLLNGIGGQSIQNNSIYGKYYGNKGGNDVGLFGCDFFHGGGGGAGGPGKDGSTILKKSGDGGPGIKWIDNNYYGGGGGASTYQGGEAGNGGIGGGGNSFVPGDHCLQGGIPGNGTNGAGNGIIEYSGLTCQAGNASPNTGGGGGGSAQNYWNRSTCKGGNGGSGIIIIRVLILNKSNNLFNKKLKINFLINTILFYY